MKKRIYLIMSLLIAVSLLAGCSSVNSSKGNTFAYNNHPKYETEETGYTEAENNNWENPLNEDYQNRDNFTVVYPANYMPAAYIPVVVPWYYYNSLWFNEPFGGFYFGVGCYPYSVYSWYSPYYMHYPYRYNPYMYGGGWWNRYPYYHNYADGRHRAKKTYTIRNFGPHRGTYNSSGTPYAGGSSSQSGRTGGRKISSKNVVKSPVDFNTTDKRIKYKPISKGSLSDFPSRSTGRGKHKIKYNKNTTTHSPIGNTSGIGSGSNSSPRPSGGSRSYGGSSGGSSKSSGGSRSSSPRSKGRGK